MWQNEKYSPGCKQNAGDGIRTRERLRDKALNLAPLTWLGNPRSKYGFDRLEADPYSKITLLI
jgi:hypothetical protein